MHSPSSHQFIIVYTGRENNMYKMGMVVAVLMIVNATQAEAQNGPIAVAQLSTDQEVIVFDVKDISGVEVSLDGARSTISLSLGDDTGQALAELTKRNLNRAMSFSVCEKEVFRAIINATITSGLIVATSEEAKVLSMSKVLSGEMNCAEYLQ